VAFNSTSLPSNISSLEQLDFSNNVTVIENYVSNSLWMWGDNAGGQLGVNDQSTRSMPVQILPLPNTSTGIRPIANYSWYQCSTSLNNQSVQFSSAISNNSILWSWGRNNSGQLGDGTTISRSSPVQNIAGSSIKWNLVSCGGHHALAIKLDGTLWAWGRNDHGQLGDGTTIDRSSPVQIGSDTNWKYISAGNNFSSMIKTNGTLWLSGNNNFGTIGDSSTVSKSSPTQIGSDTNWKQVDCGLSHVVAVKTNGTLYAWGRNAASSFNGILGDNTIISKSSPVQIGANTDWKQASAGYSSTAAVKADGSLWIWGKLLDLSGASSSSPVQIGYPGANYTWKKVSCGFDCIAALSEERRIWTAGSYPTYNEVLGRTGFNDAQRIALAIVGSSFLAGGYGAFWKDVEAGTYQMIALADFDI